MLFEEFFKKKKIDLGILQQQEPALFSEFKEHYQQMGEKSFDHTKKFWFNKLRRQFPLPQEVKAERLRPENQIAEQTIADTLTEHSATEQLPAPKLGFKPKFKTAAPAVANDEPSAPPIAEANNPDKEVPAAATPKVGFKPRFKPGVTAAKPADEHPTEVTPPAEIPAGEATESPASNPAPKVGFKPRFKAGVTTKGDETTISEEKATLVTEGEVEGQAAPEVPKPKVGFTPRFKAGVTTNKPVDETPAPPAETPQTELLEKDKAVVEAPKPKAGFTPRFKAGVTATKPVKSTGSAETPQPEPAAENKVEEVASTPKMGFKPRFKAGVTNANPVEENKPDEEEPAALENNAPVEDKVTEIPATQADGAGQSAQQQDPAPKLGFKPRFKAGVTNSKPAPDKPAEE